MLCHTLPLDFRKAQQDERQTRFHLSIRWLKSSGKPPQTAMNLVVTY